MKKIYFILSLVITLVGPQCVVAQQIISTGVLPKVYSDDQSPGPQLGTEIINTPLTPDKYGYLQNVRQSDGGTFEHVGQFYVAGNGLYGAGEAGYSGLVIATDYFGYAPQGVGTYHGPYLGSGIKGASPNNGGSGAGTPTFYDIVLTGTGDFPVEGGMRIRRYLTFRSSPTGKGNIIKVPDGKEVYFFLTNIVGANSSNYIDGTLTAGDYGKDRLFYPVGDARAGKYPYHPLELSGFEPKGSVRYLHTSPFTTNPSGQDSIKAISSVGCWIYSTQQGRFFTATIPNPVGLGNSPDPAKLRLVGWTGTQWVKVSFSGAIAPATGKVDGLEGYKLSGALEYHGRPSPSRIFALAIGTVEDVQTPNVILGLTAPTYDCTTGAFRFNTTGGDTTPIEYMAIGITGWTTNPNQFVDKDTRTAADAQPITLRARQSGKEVTYIWDIRAQCPIPGSAVSPPNMQPLRISAPGYNCATGAITFNATSGSFELPIEYMAVGITGWTTNPNQFVDKETRTAADAQPITLRARQSNGQEVAYVWDIRAVCPVSKARVGVSDGEGLQVRVLGNPAMGETVTVSITGIADQAAQLVLTDLMGRTIYQQKLIGSSAGNEVALPLGAGQTTLLLRVHTERESQQIKLVRH